jgi:prepilin-type N-terminal cleavage/methylation domain-containing protein
MNKNLGHSGYSIVELVVAIVILGTLAASASSFILSVYAIQRQARYKESAIRAASTEMETLRNEKYNTLINGQDINFTSSLPADLPPQKTGTVSVSEPTAGLKRVDVVITYKDGKKNNTVKLSSLIGQIGLSK